MLGDEAVDVVLDELFELFGGRSFIHQLAEDFVADLFIDLAFLLVEVGEEVGDFDHAVTDHLDDLVVIQADINGVDPPSSPARLPGRGVSFFALVGEDLAGGNVDDRLGKGMAHDAGGEGQLLVVLVPADPRKVVAVVVKEQRDQGA